MEGLIPFNRNALWCKKASLRASTGHSVVPSITPNANPASDSATPAHGSAPLTAPAPAAAALDPSPEDVPVLGHVTERVQEAMDYIHKKPEIGQLTQEQLIAHVIRLQDSSDIVDEFAATRSEKPRADKQRITAKRLFGNKGSATRPESRALLATRQAETQAEKEEKAARNEDRNQAKALKIAREFTRGAEVLKALENYGTPKLNALTLPDLLALLTNVDPQGTGAKPKNKTESIQRVRVLYSVQAAISRCDLAVAGVNVYI